jgi:hypothetical protein
MARERSEAPGSGHFAAILPGFAENYRKVGE